MINFRYHIVSLTAVFLALIIGILMGTTVVSRVTVDGLKANLNRAEARSAAVHRTNDRLSGELSERTDTDEKVDAALTDHVLANAVDGTLDGVPTLIVATEDVNKDVLNQTIAALGDAGAKLDGTLVVDDRMVLNDDDTQQVRELLDVPQRLDVQSAMVRQLAVALARAALPGVPLNGVSTPSTTTSTPDDGEATPQTNPGSPSTVTSEPEEPVPSTTTTVPAASEPEIIAALRQAGLVKFRPLEGSSSDAPVLEAPELANGTGYRYVFLGAAEPEPTSSEILAPLIATLAKLGPVPQVAGAGPKDPSEPGRDPFLGPLLKRDGVKGQVSTVDNLGSFAGSVALDYALAEAAEGQFGSYGIGETATAVVPPYKRPKK